MQYKHSTNLYAWCNNNPVNMVDPSGMNPWEETEFDHWQARQMGMEPPAGSPASVALHMQENRIAERQANYPSMMYGDSGWNSGWNSCYEAPAPPPPPTTYTIAVAPQITIQNVFTATYTYTSLDNYSEIGAWLPQRVDSDLYCTNPIYNGLVNNDLSPKIFVNPPSLDGDQQLLNTYNLSIDVGYVIATPNVFQKGAYGIKATYDLSRIFSQPKLPSSSTVIPIALGQFCYY